MATWNYLHRLEYRQEISKSQRVHLYTEMVEDQGWCFSHKKEDRDRWLANYTCACAQEYLERVGAAAGNYLVTVYQQFPDRQALVCAVRMRYTTPKPQITP